MQRMIWKHEWSFQLYTKLNFILISQLLIRCVYNRDGQSYLHGVIMLGSFPARGVGGGGGCNYWLWADVLYLVTDLGEGPKDPTPPHPLILDQKGEEKKMAG